MKRHVWMLAAASWGLDAAYMFLAGEHDWILPVSMAALCLTLGLDEIKRNRRPGSSS